MVREDPTLNIFLPYQLYVLKINKSNSHKIEMVSDSA